MMFDQKLEGGAKLAWPVALGLSAVLGSMALACMLPFAGVAAVAALTADARRGAGVVLAVWLANQGVGYGLLGYPVDAYSISWGLAIGAATLAAFFGAREAVRLHWLAAPLAAFALYEGLLYAFAHVAGGLHTFTPEIVAQVATNDGLWFAGLIALRFLLGRAAPGWFGSAPRLRAA